VPIRENDYLCQIKTIKDNIMAERIDSKSSTNLTLIGFAGAMVASHGIVEAVYQFYIPEIIIHFLSFACFILMFVYLFNDKFQSKHFFQSMIAAYGLILILQGIVFPLEGPNKALNVATVVLSLISYCCLISVNSRWREVNIVKRFLAAMIICELINAAILIFNVFNIENYIITDKFIAITGATMRPLIAISFSACYLARMKKKKEEGTLI